MAKFPANSPPTAASTDSGLNGHVSRAPSFPHVVIKITVSRDHPNLTFVDRSSNRQVLPVDRRLGLFFTSPVLTPKLAQSTGLRTDL